MHALNTVGPYSSPGISFTNFGPSYSVWRKRIFRYQGFFGAVSIYSKKTGICRAASLPGQHLIQENLVTLTMPFLRRVVDIFFGTSLASIPRSLRVYQIVESALIFDMCRKGNLRGLQEMLAIDGASPFVVDGNGLTMLHVSYTHKIPTR